MKQNKTILRKKQVFKPVKIMLSNFFIKSKLLQNILSSTHRELLPTVRYVVDLSLNHAWKYSDKWERSRKLRIISLLILSCRTKKGSYDISVHVYLCKV